MTYSLGQAVRSRAEASKLRCPSSLRCRVKKVQSAQPRLWTLFATRWLKCDPPQGNYHDPGRACRALRNYVELLRHHHRMCFCPMERKVTARATGVIGGRHRRVRLDFCSACGLGSSANRDIAILTPGVPVAL